MADHRSTHAIHPPLPRKIMAFYALPHLTHAVITLPIGLIFLLFMPMNWDCPWPESAP